MIKKITIGTIFLVLNLYGSDRNAISTIGREQALAIFKRCTAGSVASIGAQLLREHSSLAGTLPVKDEQLSEILSLLQQHQSSYDGCVDVSSEHYKSLPLDTATVIEQFYLGPNAQGALDVQLARGQSGFVSLADPDSFKHAHACGFLYIKMALNLCAHRWNMSEESLRNVQYQLLKQNFKV